MVVADEDGVAVAPRERYAEILVAAQKWQSEKRALIPLIEKRTGRISKHCRSERAAPSGSSLRA
jgi:hypothetical protein